MKKTKVKKGDKFGKITASTDCYKTKNGRKFIATCECGFSKEVYLSNFVGKNQKNIRCKCYKQKATNAKHGMHGTKVYRAYRNMITRCYNPKSDRYKNYGGRGVKVCDRWLGGFEFFYEDMGTPLSDKFSIGRIDNDKDYCKDNCRWETQEEQDYNKNNTVKIVVDGVEMTVKQASQKYGVDQETIRRRLRAGMKHKDAVTKKDYTAKYIIVDGTKKRVMEWFKIANIPISSFYYFKRKGMTDEDVVKMFLSRLSTQNE